MVNKELLNYIRQSLQEKTQEQIWQELKKVGWEEKAIEEAFVELGLGKKENLWGIGCLFEKSWQLYTSRLKKFLLIRLVAFAVFPAWFLFAFLVILLGNLGALAILLMILFGLLLAVGSFLLRWCVDIALLEAIKEEKIIGVKEALSRGWRKIFSYAWIRVFVHLIIFVIGFCLPFGLFGLILYLLYPFLSTALLVIIAIPLFILAFVPGTILSVWFSLVSFVFVAEGKRGMTALYRSRQLVGGLWWKVFWRLAAVRLVVSFVSLPLRQLGAIIESLLIAPFTASFYFFIYKDLAQIKAGVPFASPSRKVRNIFTAAVVLGIILPLVLLPAVLIYFIPDPVDFIRGLPEFGDSEFIPIEKIPDLPDWFPAIEEAN